MKDLETSEFPCIREIVKTIESDTDWDQAETPEKLYFYQLRAAGNVGVFEPFSDKQAELMDYLSRCNAGKRLCDYAWRIYAQSCVPR